MLDKAQNTKTFSNCQAAYLRTLPAVWKSGNFFPTANVQIGLTPFPLSGFSSLFKDTPHARRTYFLNDPLLGQKNIKEKLMTRFKEVLSKGILNLSLYSVHAAANFFTAINYFSPHL